MTFSVIQYCDANGTTNSKTVFIRSRCKKQCAMEFSGHVMPSMLVSVSHNANSVVNGKFHLLGQDGQKEMKHGFSGHIMPMAPASASCYDYGII